MNDSGDVSMPRVVYFNGEFIPEREARVSIYDSALQMGDMAFEVTRTYNGHPFHLRDHLERLYHTLSVLRIDPRVSIERLEALTLETLEKNKPTESPETDWNIIHNISRGPSSAFREAFLADQLQPTIIISCFPLTSRMAGLAPYYDRGVDLVVPQQRSIPHSLLDATIKTRSRLHYQLANFEADEKQRGATALLVDPDGFLTEGTSGNVFVVIDGVLCTPHARNLLPGITRGLILELAAIEKVAWQECDITPAMAADAEEIFLTSTTIGLLHARSFEGKTIGDGHIGPVALRLRRLFAEHVGVDFVAQAHAYRERLERKL